jgi:DNA recombination protein RmuC
MITISLPSGPIILDGIHLTLLLCVLLLAVGFIWVFQSKQHFADQLQAMGADLSAAREESDAAGIRLQQVERQLVEAEKGLATERAVLTERTHEVDSLKEARRELMSRVELAERSLSMATTQVEERERAHKEQAQAILDLKVQVEGQFATLANQALDASSQRFLELARETFQRHTAGAQGDLKAILLPVEDTLKQFRDKIDAIERVRSEDRASLTEQIQGIGQALGENRTVTAKLVTALSAPRGAGRWGEETLKNVLELAGLSSHVDFEEQVHRNHEDGADRPDAIIRLPGGRSIVVDAKVSLEEYLKASEAADPTEKKVHLVAHAKHVRSNMMRLANKGYWQRLRETPDFVAMFIPGENFFAAAVEYDRALFDDAMRNKVIIVTPATLVALAKAVAYGWRQETSAENARQVAELGKQLYDRLATMGGHIVSLGKGLSGAVKGFNSFVGSLEGNVMPSARRFVDLQVASGEKPIPLLEPLEDSTRMPLPGRDLRLSAPVDVSEGGGATLDPKALVS